MGTSSHMTSVLARRGYARGGFFQLSLGEVRDCFGEDVARDVVRCARELDKYDASRRVGIELPWHATEERELEPAEVISIMDRELGLLAKAAPPHRRRGTQVARGQIFGGGSRSARGRGVSQGRMGSPDGAVVPLPRVSTNRRGA